MKRMAFCVAVLLFSVCVDRTTAEIIGPDGQPPKKLSVPDKASQDSVLAVVKEVYGKEFVSARSTEQKSGLAKQMLKDGLAEKVAASRYVILRVAKDLASQSGDLGTAVFAIAELNKQFEVDGLKMKYSAAVAAVESQRLPKEHQALAPHLSKLIDEAVIADRYDLARAIAKVAVSSARKTRSTDFVSQATAAKKRVAEWENEFNKVEAALAVLVDEPNDPDANLAVGTFRCFVKGEWEAGVPLLALSGDEKLRDLAVKELVESPDGLAIGDGWWKIAENIEGKSRQAVQQHAAGWYIKALPELSGLAKKKVEMRLSGLEKKVEPRRLVDELTQGIWKLNWQNDPNGSNSYHGMTFGKDGSWSATEKKEKHRGTWRQHGNSVVVSHSTSARLEIITLNGERMIVEHYIRPGKNLRNAGVMTKE